MNNSEAIRQPDNLSDRIWRYMDLPRFIYLLDKRKLYLARADKFDDQHEGATPVEQKIWEMREDPNSAETLTNFRRRQRERTFISCWSHRDLESHALWRIFCGPKHGVAVCSQYFKLVGLLNLQIAGMEAGLVDYGRDDPNPPNTLVPFFRKRKAFDYENEARLVVNFPETFDQAGKLSGPRDCLEKSLDLSAFIEMIRVHPEADSNYIEVVKSLVNKYAPELLSRVEPSEMAKPPVF